MELLDTATGRGLQDRLSIAPIDPTSLVNQFPRAAPMRTRVSAEYVGKARAFRASMVAAATGVGPAMRAICRQSFELYRQRNSPLRPEQIISIEKQWRSIPAGGCLRLNIHRDKRSITIEDTRIAATTSNSSEWGDASETSICLVENSLELTKRRAESGATILAALSLHALGRWFQRARVTDPTSMMRDLTLVVNAVPDLVEKDDEVLVPSINGGSWRGAIAYTRKGQRVVNIRTFV
jgi:hypothetical protein